MRLLSLVAVAALTTGGCSAHSEDQDVLGVALTYFSQQLDKQSFGGKGVLLLRPKTRIWTEESVRYFQANPQDKCVIPQDLYGSLIKAAVKAESVSSLVPTNDLWRIGEEPKGGRMPSLPPTQFEGMPVRTVVTASQPGFSETGQEALVLLSFTWSIHDALARIRLERINGVWQARCAQFNFYV